MRKTKLVIGVLIGLLLLVVVAVMALYLVDPSVFRGQLEARGTAAFGRQVRIDGPIRLERTLRPRIIVEDITIANPDWATDEHFATAEKVGVQVALFPLLSGKLRVLDVAFSGANLFIETDPGGANNYTFADSGEPGVLPPIEQMLAKETVINYRSADGSSNRFEINEARLWNIPGEPERIEGRGSVKGKTFTLLLAANRAAELSGPQNPWSLKLDIEGPDMSLTLAGRMDHAFEWERGGYRIKISGSQADSVEELFGVDFPTTGPFELSANVNTHDGSFKVTGIACQIQGPPETPAIKILQGEASGGPDEPIQLALQGQFDDVSFAFTFGSTRPFEGASQTTPWPIEARLNLADLKLNIEGEIIPATATESLELDAQLRGETLETLSQLLDTDLPGIGPYQFTFHTQIAEGNYTFSAFKGTIEHAGPWQTLRIDRGNASGNQKGSVQASLDAKLDDVPFSLTFQGGPAASDEAGAMNWPLKLEATASGATLKGDGSVATTGNRKVLQIATHISGNRIESIGSLIGISLPAIGKFNLSADISSDGNVHQANNLKIQAGTNRLTGNVRWEEKAPRPVLSGKLSAGRLTVGKLLGKSSKPSAKTGTNGLLDRPIKLERLKKFDAKLEFNVKRLADSPISVENIRSTVTLSNGKLSVPFRGELAGASVDGQIQATQPRNLLGISVKAALGQIDVGQALKQLELLETINGTADAIVLEGSSQGETLHAVLNQATMTLRIKPANLSFTRQILDQASNYTIDSVEFFTRKDRPVNAVFIGTLLKEPFEATATATNLVKMLRTDAPLPLRVALQTPIEQLNAEVTIARPFKNNEFDMKYELTGKKIEDFSPLFDFVLPLIGEYQTMGRLKARGNKITIESDLQNGRNDLKLFLTVLQKPNHPEITGRILAEELYLEDIRLFDVDKSSEKGVTKDRSRVIPDYTIPVDVLLAADLDLDFIAERIRTQLGDLGDFASEVRIKDGRFRSMSNTAGIGGGRLSSEVDINAAVDPPLIKMQFNAEDLNFGFLLSKMDVTDLVEGEIDLLVDLSGSGATRYSILGNAAGRITIIGGPGQITTRTIDLWAADLIPTMLSSRWQRDDVTEMNCMVAHFELKEGVAEIEDLILDTQRITIAASGILNLETEALDLRIVPKPKRASLVSLANPVRIKGTLSEPEISVTKIPKKGQLAATGALAALINPLFLIFAFSDIGSGEANTCEAAVERAYKAYEADLQ